MNIDAPISIPNNQPTPNQMLEVIEAARNRVTLLEADERRLSALRQGLDNDITRKVAELNDQDKKLAVLNTNVATLKERQASLQDEIASKSDSLREITDKIAASKGMWELRETELHMQTDKNARDAASLSERVEKVALREQAVEEKEKKLEARLRRIEEASKAV